MRGRGAAQAPGVRLRPAAIENRQGTPTGLPAGVRWTLWDSIDRNALAASSQRQIEQAERTGEQARSDIALLVESAGWAWSRHAASSGHGPSLELADEVLRLPHLGPEGGHQHHAGFDRRAGQLGQGPDRTRSGRARLSEGSGRSAGKLRPLG